MTEQGGSRTTTHWRVWFRHLAGVETYVDAAGPLDGMAIARAHEVMRAVTEPPMLGWYCDRWQILLPLVGEPQGWGKPRKIVGPPLRHRLRMWWRRRLPR